MSQCFDIRVLTYILFFSAQYTPTTGNLPSHGTPVQYNAPPRPPSPMFVTVPPRPQRLVHSDAYIKYIEGLTTDRPSDRISKFS